MRSDGLDESFRSLTRRHIEVLGALTLTFRHTEIAQVLSVSVPTVRSHLREIYRIVLSTGKYSWRIIICAPCVLLVAIAATAGCSPGSPTAWSPGAGMDFVVPSNSLDDWVSYAEQVSIVTVLGEEHGPDDTGVSGRGEGHVSGVLSLRIEETLWIAPGVVPRSGNLQVVSLGWTVHDGNWHAINPELKPGVSYLVPLAQFKSGLSPMRPPSIAVVQGRIAASTQAVRSFNGAWSNELDGLVLDQVKTKIEAAHPNERAMQFASLDVEDQVDAVLHGGRR